jgi:hypothetical protein
MSDETLKLARERFEKWPNCSIPDCSNKACLGLSDTKCFPHYFHLRMDDEGNAIFPDEQTKRVCHSLLRAALKQEQP